MADLKVLAKTWPDEEERAVKCKSGGKKSSEQGQGQTELSLQELIEGEGTESTKGGLATAQLRKWKQTAPSEHERVIWAGAGGGRGIQDRHRSLRSLVCLEREKGVVA